MGTWSGARPQRPPRYASLRGPLAVLLLATIGSVIGVVSPAPLAGAASSGGLSLVVGQDGSANAVTLITPYDLEPSVATVTDDFGDSCNATFSNPSHDGVTWVGSCVFIVNGNVVSYPGDTVTATVSGPLYDLNTGTTIPYHTQVTAIAPGSTLELTTSTGKDPIPGTNTYNVSLIVGLGTPAPNEPVVIDVDGDDSGTYGGDNSCNATLTNPSADDETYTGSCTFDNETADSDIDATYDEDGLDPGYSPDTESLEIAEEALTLATSTGNAPVAGTNTYNVTLSVPVGGPAPSEPVIITDDSAGDGYYSDGNTCNATLTNPSGDGATYTGSCTFDDEPAGTAVEASYDSDELDPYYYAAIQTLTIAGETLDLSGYGDGGTYSYTVTLIAGGADEGNPTPSAPMVVTDSNGKTCNASLGILTGLGGWTGTCTLTGETPGDTVTATYDADAADTNYTYVKSGSWTVVDDLSEIDLYTSTEDAPVVGTNIYDVYLPVDEGDPTPSEPVVVTDSNGKTCNAALALVYSEYIGSCSLTGETAGATVTASYDEDGLDLNYTDYSIYSDSSTPTSNTLTVISNVTLGLATSTTKAPVVGSNTYNATLSVPAGGPAPTAPVIITDSNGVTCTIPAPLTGSGTTYTGTCTLPGETVGATVTATYEADGVYTNYSLATSNTLTVANSVTLGLATSTTKAPVVGSNTYNVTLSVSPSAPTPTDPVIITDSNGVTCSAPLTGSGTAYTGNCTLPRETAGATVTATYDADGADTNYSLTTSNTLLFKSVATLVLTTATLNPPVAGDNTYVVALSVPAGGSPPSDPVIITDSNGDTCTTSALVASSGTTYTASCTISSEAASLSSTTVVATYDADGADTNYSLATSNTLTVKYMTTLSLSSTGDGCLVLQCAHPGSNTYEVTLSMPAGGYVPDPSEPVIVTDSNGASCSIALPSNASSESPFITKYEGSCVLANETMGTTITATYGLDGADPNYPPATSNTLTVNTKATPSVIVTYSPLAPVPGGTLTFSAQVAGGAPSDPTGTVAWTLTGPGDPTCSTVTLGPTDIATCTISDVAAGNYSASAQYSGDSNYSSASSSTATVLAETPGTVAGAVGQVFGSVTITSYDGTVTTAVAGSPIATGDTITTSATGTMLVTFADGSTVYLSEETTFTVNQYIYNSQTQQGSSFFTILQGVFQYVGGLIDKNDPADINIQTPVGSLGIRGTEFIAQVNPGQNSVQIDLILGEVAFTPTLSSVATVVTAPGSASFNNSSLISTTPLTQAEYDLLVTQFFSSTSTPPPLATPTLMAAPSASAITLGTTPVTLKDTAILSNGNNPTGSITFTLFFDGGTSPIDTETVPVSGNGSYTTPAGYTLPETGNVTGTYQWDVSYSGDTNNATATDSDTSSEQVIVSPAKVIPVKMPKRPKNITIAFGTRHLVLSSGERLSLRKLSRHLLAGASVTVTGFARSNQPLAHRLAQMVAKYLTSLVKVHVTLRTITRLAVTKVVVATIKQ